MWSHEFIYKLWAEDPAPIIEAIRGYVATDYDYPENLQKVRDDLEGAKRDVMEGVSGEGRDKLAAALQMSLNMNPLTPDHHFYVDQGRTRACGWWPSPSVASWSRRGRSPTLRTSCSCATTSCGG